MNVVWGIRWDRGLDRRGRAPSGGAGLTLPAPSSSARAASPPARAVNVRSPSQLFPPARLSGLILDLLRGVSGRQRAGVEPMSWEAALRSAAPA
jgi:hypothetical protein